MPSSEELPRIIQLNASCCEARIVRFDMPSREKELLEEDAAKWGWVKRSDEWICDHHKSAQ